MCLYLYMHNKYTQYTQMYYVNKNVYFGMRLITINHLIALLFLYNNNVLNTKISILG